MSLLGNSNIPPIIGISLVYMIYNEIIFYISKITGMGMQRDKQNTTGKHTTRSRDISAQIDTSFQVDGPWFLPSGLQALCTPVQHWIGLIWYSRNDGLWVSKWGHQRPYSFQPVFSLLRSSLQGNQWVCYEVTQAVLLVSSHGFQPAMPDTHFEKGSPIASQAFWELQQPMMML